MEQNRGLYPGAPQNGEPSSRALLPTRRSAVIFCLSLAAAGIVFVAFFRYIFFLANLIIPDCPMNSIFGLRCPLCGATRCVRALVGLDISQAVYYNPLVVILCPFLAYVLLRVVISCFAREYKPYKVSLGKYGSWIVLVVALAFYVLRNLPFYRAILY